MDTRLYSRRLPWLLVAVQLVLLAVVAVLQYRWTGELSRAEEARLRRGIAESAERFAEELHRELTRAFLFFQPVARAGAEEGTAAWDRWRQTAPWPGMIDAIYRVERQRDGLSLTRLEPEAARFVDAPWPPELTAFHDRLRHGAAHRERHRLRRGGERGGELPPSPLLAPEVPAVLVPFFGVHGGRWPLTESGARRDAQDDGPVEPGELLHAFIDGCLVLHLDTAYLGDTVFPELARRYFGAGGRDGYQVAVLGERGPLYRSDAAAPPAGARAVDLERPLFDFLADEEQIRRLLFEMRLDGEPRDVLAGDFRRGLTGRFVNRHFLPRLLSAGGPADAWRLLVRHSDGSLEEAVARVRRHNLAISLSVLLLLALTVSMLMVSGRRAQRLAAQQVEFVAGVTHELRTPLAAIQSLGQNLADGVVAAPDQVRRYGALIQRQGQRLGRMVEQVLELSGILAERRSLHREPTPVAAVVEAALADCRPLIEEAGAEVHVDLAPGLPPISADAPALVRALANLIGNAVKYGVNGSVNGGINGGGAAGGDRRVEVTAALAGQSRGRREVRLTVADHGPGVAREELPHLFEPFFRGRDAVAAQIQGSGLGLSLVRHTVEAHGGRVTVESAPGDGSTFSLYLPADHRPTSGEARRARPEDPAD